MCKPPVSYGWFARTPPPPPHQRKFPTPENGTPRVHRAAQVGLKRVVRRMEPSLLLRGRGCFRWVQRVQPGHEMTQNTGVTVVNRLAKQRVA